MCYTYQIVNMCTNTWLGRLQPTYELKGRNAIPWCPPLVAAVSFAGQSYTNKSVPTYWTVSTRPSTLQYNITASLLRDL